MINNPKFQINSSVLFLTYPECDVHKEDLFSWLCSYEQPKALEVLVAREKHANGNLHLHAYVKFDKAYRTKDPREFDFRGFHGNYQGARSAKNVIKYCTKEEDYISNFDIATLLQKGCSQKELLGKRIWNGEALIKIIEEQPKFIFGYAKLREDLKALREDQEELSNETELPSELPNPWNKRFIIDTDVKKRHYWFYSKEPNKGKTTGCIMPLVKDHKAYLLNPEDTYHEIRKSTKIICIDEFNEKQLKAQTLNKICDGTFKFRVFMRGTIGLESEPIVVVCSNYSINEIYPLDFKYIEARFNEVCVD